jgi:pilus assembly protein TadC
LRQGAKKLGKYNILLIYYFFVILGSSIFLYKNYFTSGRKYTRRRSPGMGIKRVIKILNIFAHKTGNIFVNDPKMKIGVLNIRILKILEEDEGIIVTPGSFTGYKILLGILFSTGGAFFGDSLVSSILLAMGSGISGYFIPDILIRKQARKISANIDTELPYMIDLLRIAVLSGQNIYNSFKILVEKYRAKICFDLRDYIKDIDWGLGKETAYINMIEKNKSRQFADLMAVLLEAEKYGSPLDDILEQKSKQINFENMENIEKKARRTTVLTLIPLVFLILPAFVLLVGGPLIFVLGNGIFVF